MNLRIARPTLRLLREDLKSDWEDPGPRRALDALSYEDLQPMSELPHPIIAKAVEVCGPRPEDDRFVGPIGSSTRHRLMEIKSGQWRGGVWYDPVTSSPWLVVAGLAKGGHQDRDDFYERVKRANDSGAVDDWLPTDEDTKLLKQEMAEHLLSTWQLGVQVSIADLLEKVCQGGEASVDIAHPIENNDPLANLDLEVVRDGDVEHVFLKIKPDKQFANSTLIWQLTERVLITLHPPVSDWDRFENTYSNIAEPGHWKVRAARLQAALSGGNFIKAEVGVLGHYVEKRSVAENSVLGRASRAICGIYFVPTRDPDSVPVCTECESIYEQLSD